MHKLGVKKPGRNTQTQHTTYYESERRVATERLDGRRFVNLAKRPHSLMVLTFACRAKNDDRISKPPTVVCGTGVRWGRRSLMAPAPSAVHERLLLVACHGVSGCLWSCRLFFPAEVLSSPLFVGRQKGAAVPAGRRHPPFYSSSSSGLYRQLA